MTLLHYDRDFPTILKGETLKIIFLLFSLSRDVSNPSWAQLSKEKVLIGRIESAQLPELKKKPYTRIDTSAQTLSMQAVNIEANQPRGELVMRFQTSAHEAGPVHL